MMKCFLIYVSGAFGAKGDSMNIMRGHLGKLTSTNNFFCNAE
jgi:hypothetical protein